MLPSYTRSLLFWVSLSKAPDLFASEALPSIHFQLRAPPSLSTRTCEYRVFQKTNTSPQIPQFANVPLLRPLWSLLDGIWGILKGSWGALSLYEPYGTPLWVALISFKIFSMTSRPRDFLIVFKALALGIAKPCHLADASLAPICQCRTAFLQNAGG